MSRPGARFDAIIEREKGLHRGLSSGQLSMIAIGGAIGTGLFLGSSTAIYIRGSWRSVELRSWGAARLFVDGLSC
jgi:amino acid permease